MTPRAKLKLVQPDSCPEDMLIETLRDLFTHRDIAADFVAQYDAKIAEGLRLLAKSRGVAFIRVETARREVMGG